MSFVEDVSEATVALRGTTRTCVVDETAGT